MPNDINSTARRQSDLAGKPVSFILAWAIPGLILFSMNFAQGVIPFEGIVMIMAGTLLWMGLGCVLNARRCHRRHCIYSGPILIAGAAAVLLVGFEFITLGSDGLINVVWGTFALVALTFIPELIWGKYARPNGDG